jgi:hypothetical protein
LLQREPRIEASGSERCSDRVRQPAGSEPRDGSPRL